MHGRGLPAPGRLLVSLIAVWFLTTGTVAASDDQDWLLLVERSREALSSLAPDPAAPEASGCLRTIVVGFTGGLEGGESRISGVVRLRKKIEQSAAAGHDVAAFTYNNREWATAAADVLALIRRHTPPLAIAADRIGPHEAAADDGLPGARATEDGSGCDELPLIIAYGHSWGAGAVTKFARRLGEADASVALAIYIDAFSLRNPRVPANVRYAVNVYQRTGIFRGFPLRGKSKLVLEAPESTVVLANLRIKPETEHFGWHWNLVQPLLYRHHHRMSHDVRLQRYLLELLPVAESPDAPVEPHAPAPGLAIDRLEPGEAAGLRY